ncbi:MAG: DUF47 family protein [Candidatus Aenigmatarchaeota archaeon]
MKLRFWRPPFFLSPEQDVYEKVLGFTKDVVIAVDAMCICTRAFVSGKRADVEKGFSILNKAENDADNKRRTIEIMLFGKRFFDREEKVEMLEKIDTVADYAKMTAQIMLSFPCRKMEKGIGLHLIDMANHTFHATKNLESAVKYLYIDWKNVSRYVEMIEREREEAEKAYNNLLKRLFASKLNDRLLMIIRDVAYRIERTITTAEEAGDRLRFLAVKHG